MENMANGSFRSLVEIVDKVAVSSEEKNIKIKIAHKLEAYHKLDPKAGVGPVLIFETEDELREEVIKTCSFEIGVQDDGSMRGLQFRRMTEDGEVSNSLELVLPAGAKIRSISMLLAWLAWTQEYKKVPSLWGFTFQEGNALFHRRRQLRELEDRWEWERKMDYHHNADLAEMPRACFDKGSGKFYCEKPSRLRSARKVRHRPMREERHATGAIMGYYESNEDFVAVEADYDASSLFHSYESLIAQDLDIIRSEASIDLTVQPNTPLLSRLKASLDRRLGDVIGSELETSRFTPDEIYKMIGRYWDELIYSPWDSKTTNEYALLKNLCKRGSDDVNVWSEQTKGLFGFKVRTRDHSWIKGQIYCPSDCLSPTESTDIGKATCEGRADFTCKIGGSAYTSWKHHSMILGEVVSVGRCKFFISKERD